MGKTQIPENFVISEGMRAWAAEKMPGVDIEREHENFCDYWRGHGKKMADWVATWRVWMRRAPQFQHQGTTGRKPYQRAPTTAELEAEEAQKLGITIEELRRREHAQH